jgi:hypothetical protein
VSPSHGACHQRPPLVPCVHRGRDVELAAAERARFATVSERSPRSTDRAPRPTDKHAPLTQEEGQQRVRLAWEQAARVAAEEGALPPQPACWRSSAWRGGSSPPPSSSSREGCGRPEGLPLDGLREGEHNVALRGVDLTKERTVANKAVWAYQKAASMF